MKKWIGYILISFLLLFAFPSIALAEELDSSEVQTGASGTLTENGNDLMVALTLPQGKTENESDKITSLRFQLSVSIQNGSMDKPVFTFDQTIKSEVKDAEITTEDSSNYLVDIILSGTKDQSIFKNETANIGTLSLKPTTKEYQISVDFVKKADHKNPFVEYVTSMGQKTQTVFLENFKTAVVEKEKTPSDTPDNPNKPNNPNTPDNPNTPSNPSVPSTPGISGGTTTPSTETPKDTENTDKTENNKPSTSETVNKPENNTGNTQEPSTSTIPNTKETFDNKEKPKAEVTSKIGKKRISFEWEQVNGADGYIIYQKNKKTGKYKRIKTISDPTKTTFQKKMKQGVSYSFKVRAYTTAEDGSKTFGKYSSVISITTAPAKVKGLKVKSVSNSKVKLSWKKVKNAKGYQIFSSKKKNGKYHLVKTLKKASALTATIKQNRGQTYYKVRAFVKDAENDRIYGNFCVGKKL